MSSATRTLTYIEIATAILGATAATLVATAAPQPFFGMAFWLYVISAILGAYLMYRRGLYAMMCLLIYYIGIDSYGIYTWWPF